jgi:hypothetical protein
VTISLLAFEAAGRVFADGPAGVTLEALPLQEAAPGQESIVLSARLTSDAGPVAGVPVTFYVVTTVFGERLMKVGEALSDATGIASVLYRPSWEGEHTAVARYAGNDVYPATQTSFSFGVEEASSLWEPAEFGLEPLRRWLPLAVGIGILAVLGALGYALITAVLGIPAAAESVPDRQPLPAWDPRVQRPAPLGKALLGMAVLLAAAAIPAAWLIGKARMPDEVGLSTGDVAFQHDHDTGDSPDFPAIDLPPPEPLQATLVSSLPLTRFDDNGQPAPGSVAMPSDVAIASGRVRILDSTMGRVITVTPEGRLASILDAAQYGNVSLAGAPAMAALGPDLYITTADGEIVVVNSAGEIAGIIKPIIPDGLYHTSPGGIALGRAGVIWISDAANHRVLALNERGEYGLVIGNGAPSSDATGLDTPGGLAVDVDGNVYVADTGNRAVKKFSQMGVFLQTIGEGRLGRPTSVAIGEDGTVFVTDESALLVSAFAADGTYKGSIGEGQLQAPHSVKTEGGLIYVMDRLAGLFLFDTGGATVYAGEP